MKPDVVPSPQIERSGNSREQDQRKVPVTPLLWRYVRRVDSRSDQPVATFHRRLPMGRQRDPAQLNRSNSQQSDSARHQESNSRRLSSESSRYPANLSEHTNSNARHERPGDSPPRAALRRSRTYSDRGVPSDACE